MRLKQLDERIYAWKMSRVGGASSTGTLSLEEHLVGGTEFSSLKTDSQLLSLSLCSARKSRASLKLGLLQKLAAITPGRVLKIEPTLRQISEETLESLKLRERNFNI